MVTATSMTPRMARETVAGWLTHLKPRLAEVLPAALPLRRMAQVALTESVRNPKLAECTPQSFASALILCAELGLEPSSGLGKAYLIPRWNARTRQTECTLQVGYKGYCELALRSGKISRLNAQVVYRDEIARGVFRATIEPPAIHHDYSADDIERTDTALVLAYATAQLRDGSYAQVILTRAQIDARRMRSGQSGSGGPWATDYSAMARKSALRALLTSGLVPLASDQPVARAVVAEDDADRGDGAALRFRSVESSDPTMAADDDADVIDVPADVDAPADAPAE